MWVKVAGKRGRREHEKLRVWFILAEVNPQRTIMKSELNDEQWIICDRINMFALFWASILWVGQPCYLKGWAPSTPKQFRCMSSSSSAETAQTPNSTYDSHYVLGCVSLEVLSRRLMVTHYYQTANCLLPLNLGKFPKNSVLQVYNTVMISHFIGD
jgi:hypothetical protein